jgi:hypothetical protein
MGCCYETHFSRVSRTFSQTQIREVLNLKFHENFTDSPTSQIKDDPIEVEIVFCKIRQLHKISQFFFFASLARLAWIAIIFSRKPILFSHKILAKKGNEARCQP